MRCDNCEYCVSDYLELYFHCIFGPMEVEDKKGNFGCKYNKKTLDKMRREQLKEEKEMEKEL